MTMQASTRGTTRKRMGFRAIGIEKEPEYAEQAKIRVMKAQADIFKNTAKPTKIEDFDKPDVGKVAFF